MKKEAQTKPYSNPEREQLNSQKESLRAAKKQWNSNSTAFQKKLKEFKSELFNLKNMLNGRFEGKERVKLWEEMPPEVEAAVSNLTENYGTRNEEAAALLQQAKTIIDYQKGYSNNYKNFYSKLELNRQQQKNQTTVPDENLKKANDTSYSLYSEALSSVELAIQNAKASWPFLSSRERNKISVLNKIYNLDDLYSKLEDKVLKVKSYQDVSEVSALKDKIMTEIPRIVSSGSVKSLVKQDSVDLEINEGRSLFEVIKKIKAEVGFANAILAVIYPKIDLLEAGSNKEEKEKYKKLSQESLSRIERIIGRGGFGRTYDLTKPIDPWEQEALSSQLKSLYSTLVESLTKLVGNISVSDQRVDNFTAINFIYNNLDAYENDINLLDDTAGDTFITKKIKQFKRFTSLDADKNTLYDLIHNEIRPILSGLLNEIYNNDSTGSIIKTLYELEPLNRELIKQINSILGGISTVNLKDHAVKQEVKHSKVKQLAEKFNLAKSLK